MLPSERRVRMMEPRDLPSLWREARAQNRRDGTSYGFPEVFDLDPKSPGYGRLKPGIALALVTEVRRGDSWRVRQGHVFLKTIEVMSFGGGKEDMAFSAPHIPVAFAMLAGRDFDAVHCFVPRDRATEEHQALLEKYGLDRVDHRLAHFLKAF